MMHIIFLNGFCEAKGGGSDFVRIVVEVVLYFSVSRFFFLIFYFLEFDFFKFIRMVWIDGYPVVKTEIVLSIFLFDKLNWNELISKIENPDILWLMDLNRFNLVYAPLRLVVWVTIHAQV